MKTPYEILDIPTDADDDTVKKAYLRKVKEFPPERNPEAFQTIRTAYEQVETANHRFHHDLFHHQPPDLSALNHDALRASSVIRSDSKTIAGILAESALNSFLKLIR